MPAPARGGRGAGPAAESPSRAPVVRWRWPSLATGSSPAPPGSPPGPRPRRDRDHQRDFAGDAARRSWCTVAAGAARSPTCRAARSPAAGPGGDARGAGPADAALDYLREQFRRIPRCLYALPGARPSRESLARWSCHRRPRRWRCGRWQRVPGPARPAWYCSARWSPAAPATGNWCSRSNSFRVPPRPASGPGAVATCWVAGRSFDELVRHTWTIVPEASRKLARDAARAGRRGRGDHA